MAIKHRELENIEAFKGFSEKQLAKLRNLCVDAAFSENEQLFAEGDLSTHLWMVTEGRVELRFEIPGKRPATTEQTVSVIEISSKKSMAETLGWSCFVPPFRMRLSAYCVSPICRIILIPKDELLKIFEDDPLLGYRFMSYMVTVVGYRFHKFQELFASMLFVYSGLKPRL